MDLGLAGKVTIVTGGASNIGRAIVLGLAKEEAKVVIVDLDDVQAQKVVQEAKGLGAPSAIAIKTDVTDWDQVQTAMKEALEKFNRIDILVNNVGGGFVKRLFIEENPSIWEKTLALNFRSMIYCTRAVLDQMMRQKSGVIVSVSSDAGKIPDDMAQLYSSSKAAVNSMTRGLASELGSYGIRFNAVCPAFTPPEDFSGNEVGEMSVWRWKETGQMLNYESEIVKEYLKKTPLGKLGKAEDIANAVLFMASDRVAGHITGQALSVDGGYTMI